MGDVIAKHPAGGSARRWDITGGLPRVADLFEARKPKEPAVLTEASGTMVSFGKETQGQAATGDHHAGRGARSGGDLIPKWRSISMSLHDGEHVRTGRGRDADGPSSPHDILRLKGVAKALAKYIINEIQEVYRLQGVTINDKHIEVIVRQMLRKVEITDAGDSDVHTRRAGRVHVTPGSRSTRSWRRRARSRPAIERVLLGITKASLWPPSPSSRRRRSRRPRGCSPRRRSPASRTSSCAG